MQLEPIRYEICVCPPKYICSQRYQIWKLRRLLYGGLKAGRQCLYAIEGWLISTVGIELMTEVDSHLANRGGDGESVLSITKVIDDI